MSRPTRYIKRSNTPALNRRRAVEYRHRRYSKPLNDFSIYNDAIALEMPAVEEIVLDEALDTEVEVINEELVETTEVKEVKEVKEEKVKEPFSVKYKRFRKERIDRRNAYLDSVINEPKANVAKMLLFAGTAVKSIASVRDVTLNGLAVLFLNAVKWLALGAVFANLIGLYINIFPFSVSRINFTGMAKIAVFIGLFALICEYASYLLISIYCGIQRDNVKMRKLADISARGSVLPTCLYIIAIILTIYKSVTIGTIFAISSIVVAFVLKVYGLTQHIKISVTKQLFIYFLCVFVSCLLFIKILPFFSENLINILKGLLNI